MKLRPDDPKLMAVWARGLIADEPKEALAVAQRAAKLAPKGDLDNMVLAVTCLIWDRRRRAFPCWTI
jgi:hypothetical protein